MPPEQASARGKQPGPKPHDSYRRGHAPDGGAGGMDGMRSPFEQVTGIRQPTSGPPQVFGIDTHAY